MKRTSGFSLLNVFFPATLKFVLGLDCHKRQGRSSLARRSYATMSCLDSFFIALKLVPSASFTRLFSVGRLQRPVANLTGCARTCVNIPTKDMFRKQANHGHNCRLKTGVQNASVVRLFNEFESFKSRRTSHVWRLSCRVFSLQRYTIFQ